MKRKTWKTRSKKQLLVLVKKRLALVFKISFRHDSNQYCYANPSKVYQSIKCSEITPIVFVCLFFFYQKFINLTPDPSIYGVLETENLSRFRRQ